MPETNYPGAAFSPHEPIIDRARPDLNILSILKERESLIESEQRVGSL